MKNRSNLTPIDKEEAALAAGFQLLLQKVRGPRARLATQAAAEIHNAQAADGNGRSI